MNGPPSKTKSSLPISMCTWPSTMSTKWLAGLPRSYRVLLLSGSDSEMLTMTSCFSRRRRTFSDMTRRLNCIRAIQHSRTYTIYMPVKCNSFTFTIYPSVKQHTFSQEELSPTWLDDRSASGLYIMLHSIRLIGPWTVKFHQNRFITCRMLSHNANCHYTAYS